MLRSEERPVSITGQHYKSSWLPVVRRNPSGAGGGKNVFMMQPAKDRIGMDDKHFAASLPRFLPRGLLSEAAKVLKIDECYLRANLRRSM